MSWILEKLKLNGLFAKGEGRRIGRIVKRLGMRGIYLDRPRWQWRRVHFKEMSLGTRSRLNPHIAIVGESGSGKSNACKVMIRSLVASGVNVAVLDPHNEYLGVAEQIGAEVYDAAHNGINIFELDGVSEKEKTNELTNMFKRVFRLGDVQGYQLYKAIMFTYNRLGSYGKIPNIHDLLYTLQIFKRHANGMGESRILEGLERRLSLIDTGAFSRSTDMEKVMNGRSVFLLSGLHTNESQSVYLEGFLRKVYGRMLTMEKRSSARLYIVIDEAEKLGQRSVAGKIAAEGRKYGIGLIAMAQRSKSIDKEIRANASLFMAFYQREPEELNYIANLVAGGNELNRFVEVKKALRNLHTGSAIVLDSSEPNPFVTRFELSSDNGTCLAYEIMSMARAGVHLQGLIDRASAKGFEPEAAEKKIREMTAGEALSEYQVAEGSRYDGRWYISAPRNTPEHDICVNVVKQHLESMGLRCIIYNSSFGPDVIAYYGKERIAVEYETGSKSRESTEKMLTYRNRIYPRVLMIVNDERVGAYSELAGAKVLSLSEFLNEKEISRILA